jgi:hypothetical protein
MMRSNSELAVMDVIAGRHGTCSSESYIEVQKHFD